MRWEYADGSCNLDFSRASRPHARRRSPASRYQKVMTEECIQQYSLITTMTCGFVNEPDPRIRTWVYPGVVTLALGF